jgi:hypothetical protein
MSTQNVCNICGANYIYRNGKWVCPACGAYKEEELSPEEATLLYNAAQKLRLSNFSEAEDEYSDIIGKFPQNANAYWGRLLSKYGIKYEEDFDGRKIPTCYAASIESVITDNDYLRAIELADPDARVYFTQQAEYIERVRQEWINKAQKEKPYDVFICYKDSDLEKGIERTEDSINAYELYIHLRDQGYRVFFSRESLRDKVGEKYEPYIFNALSTAKVMLVYGSSAEYIKSTWLKNEWHRYYKKVVAGEKHQESLVVACKGFSPSELPTILSSRQCLDAKRMTFLSDLDKCIKRIIQESPEQAPSPSKKEETLFSGLHEHTYKTKVVKATCIAKGYTIHKCDCGYEYRDTYTPLVDHSFKVDERVDPTCTKDGYEKKTCKICGESITDRLSALEHQFTKWVETKHPACAEDGESKRQCTRCGHIEKKAIARTGHKYGAWVTTSNGTQTRHCANCGSTQTRENITDNHYHTSTVQKKSRPASTPWAMFWICVFTGYFGMHKFIEGKIGKGILYYCTAGLFFVGWISDCVKLYRIAKSNTKAPSQPQQAAQKQAYPIQNLFHNMFDYWKALLTNDISFATKIRRILGLTITAMFTCVIVASNLADVNNVDIADHPVANALMSIGAILIFFNILFGIIAIVTSAKEKNQVRNGTIVVPEAKKSRVGLKIGGYFLLVLSTSWWIVRDDSAPTAMLAILAAFWSIVCILFSYCPEGYDSISITPNRSFKKSNFGIIGFALSIWLLIVSGLITS